jgi:hypothetical protein
MPLRIGVSSPGRNPAGRDEGTVGVERCSDQSCRLSLGRGNYPAHGARRAEPHRCRQADQIVSRLARREVFALRTLSVVASAGCKSPGLRRFRIGRHRKVPLPQEQEAAGALRRPPQVTRGREALHSAAIATASPRAPLALISSIRCWLKPSTSCRISRLCSPSSGERSTIVGLSESLMGLPTER